MTHKIGKNSISFDSYGDKVKADLYLPENSASGEKRPVVIVTPPATGVKEQTAGLYAHKLSEKGFVAIAFDPRGWGESEGRKSYLSPYRIAEDLRNAINYATTLDEVDDNHIFNLGICMGAAIAGMETAFDSRVKALATISPYLVEPDTFIKAYGSAENIRSMMLPGISMSSQSFFTTGQDVFTKPVPETEEEIKKASPIAVGMRDYYFPGQPGSAPNWRNEQSVTSTIDLLNFSVFHYIPSLEPVSLYTIYGGKAVSAGGAINFYEQYLGKKERLVFDEAGHFDLYWKDEYVTPAVEAIDKFFNEYIG